MKLELCQLRWELYCPRSFSSPWIIILQNLYRCLWNAATLAPPKRLRPAGATTKELTSSDQVCRECYLIEDEAERKERKLGGAQPLAFCQNNWMCKKKKTPDRMCICKLVSGSFFYFLLVSTVSEVTYHPLKNSAQIWGRKNKTQPFYLSSSKGICQPFQQATTFSSDRKLHAMIEDASVTPCTAVGPNILALSLKQTLQFLNTPSVLRAGTELSDMRTHLCWQRPSSPYLLWLMHI